MISLHRFRSLNRSAVKVDPILPGFLSKHDGNGALKQRTAAITTVTSLVQYL